MGSTSRTASSRKRVRSTKIVLSKPQEDSSQKYAQEGLSVVLCAHFDHALLHRTGEPAHLRQSWHVYRLPLLFKVGTAGKRSGTPVDGGLVCCDCVMCSCMPCPVLIGTACAKGGRRRQRQSSGGSAGRKGAWGF